MRILIPCINAHRNEMADLRPQIIRNILCSLQRMEIPPRGCRTPYHHTLRPQELTLLSRTTTSNELPSPMVERLVLIEFYINPHPRSKVNNSQCFVSLTGSYDKRQTRRVNNNAPKRTLCSHHR